MWKIINGFPNYEVSDEGHIRNIKTGKILKHLVNRNGYASVNLYHQGRHIYEIVHKIVALHFIPNPDNLPEINHKDECRMNPSVTNLEWCTHQYNNQYGTKSERMLLNRKGKCAPKGVNCCNLEGVVLTKYTSFSQAAKDFGTSATLISRLAQSNHIRPYRDQFLFRMEES